jgi:branched-chain amino acid transport system ATP-binding protein
MTLLSVSGLSVHYGGIRAVRSVDLEVEPGEAVAILGPNGAGKTTLLRTIAGLERPAEGRVELAGRDVTGAPAERLVRAGIALVPEGRGVFADLPVRDNLLLGAYHRRHRSEDLADVYSLFPILAERARQPAGTLSGGEQQMLAIGRALMSRPRLLMLDEPSLGLAPLAVRQVVDRLLELRARGTTILLVEQNIRAALQVATRGYVLQRGRVLLEGTSDELREAPAVRAAYLGASAARTSEGSTSRLNESRSA